MTIQPIASQEQGEHFTDLLHGLGKKNPWSVTRDFFIWGVMKSQSMYIAEQFVSNKLSNFIPSIYSRAKFSRTYTSNPLTVRNEAKHQQFFMTIKGLEGDFNRYRQP